MTTILEMFISDSSRFQFAYASNNELMAEELVNLPGGPGEQISLAKPYILSPSAAKLITEKAVGNKSDPDIPFHLPLPFDRVWVECYSNENQLWNLFTLTDRGGKLAGYPRRYVAVFAQKLPNNSYLFMGLDHQPDRPDYANFHSYILTEEKYRNLDAFGMTFHRVFFEVFNNLRGEFVLGSEKVNIRGRIGTGKARRPVKIKDIIHIMSKPEREVLKKDKSRDIDWSHRWEVGGHWRRHDGIGKDPAGHYCIKGRTWVEPHVKGPENKPIVPKTRLVKGNN